MRAPLVSSWALEAAIRCGRTFNWIYLFCGLISLIFKTYKIEHISYSTELIVLLVLTLVWEPARFYLGSRSNKLDRPFSMVLFMLSTAVTFLCVALYYLTSQRIVLRLDVASSVVHIIFDSAQTLLAFVQVMRLYAIFPQHLV